MTSSRIDEQDQLQLQDEDMNNMNSNFDQTYSVTEDTSTDYLSTDQIGEQRDEIQDNQLRLPNVEEEDDIQAIHNDSQSIAATKRLSQEHATRHVPLIGMKFSTHEEAYSFYNNYALIIGFSITRFSTYPCKNKKDPMFGKTIRRTFKCNMHGRKTESENNTTKPRVQKLKIAKKKSNATPHTSTTNENKRKTSAIVLTDCLAESIITLTGGIWTITRIILDHNHPLAARDQKNCLWSQTKMFEIEQKLV
uniref:FAR1 domain-containing protein n=1 Tax=Arundo donax TaxID=35708 RepID=A0A0A8XRD1_ARUDO